ncbi:Cytochrome P [Parasponia andersonii]|uniref:Cytochrome P n=1 Tax=Parasponia andersonii TaxID=3476 RepID=A0A2P5BYA8_PARAD|nr:Cytochrome P [Parasponia andersonii]
MVTHHDVKHYGFDLFDILILLSLSAFAALWFRRTTTNKSSSAPPLPPGPRGLPLVGYLPFLSPNLHRDFSELATVYGPIFKFWMGTKLCVVITSPPLVGEVVRDQDTVFANRDVSTCALVATHGGHDVAFASYGPEWKKLRKIFVREMSNNTVLNNLYGLRREEVRKSVRHIYEKVKTTVDIGALAFLTAINSIMSMTIGASLHGDNAAIDSDQFKKAAEDLVTLLGKPNVSDVFPALKWFDIQGIERDTREITRVFEVMFDSAMAERKNNMIDPTDKKKDMRKDFLQFLMDLHENEDGATSITMPEIKALLMVPISTANLL